MRLLLIPALLLALSGCVPASVASETASVGAPAPDFTLTDTDGNTVALSSYAGKTVVLEWFNPDCPFVKYAHGAKGPLKEQPGRVTSDEVVWLAINSGAPGKQGHGLERNQRARTEFGIDYPVLLDEDGTVGRLYGARTTPHMYVVDTAGTLVFAGALDGDPMGSGDKNNAVDTCLTDLADGNAVANAYGCSVKYGK